MPHRTFFFFILPSLTVMFLFIALPIVSVAIQSFYVEHEQVLETIESCGPFGCTTSTRVDTGAMASLREEAPLGRFNGLGTYLDPRHLANDEVAAAWAARDGLWDFVLRLMNMPFYKALGFTIVYTAVVTPLVIVLGLFIAMGVNGIPKLFKGPIIFFSLLPMIVTPLIGSLVLFWMIDENGILGATLQLLFDDPQLSLRASPTLTWIVLMTYGVWHMLPFSFLVFYAGLQTVPQDTLESAIIDGANRWERTRDVIVPHLMPLVVFIALVQLMDNFRVFEPIIGFQASADATSLSWLIFNDLRGSDTPLYGSAAATSLLTIVGIFLLLTPVLVRTWRDFSAKPK
ncbi:MAG: carbohydrate ABC transporter permease [Paracoccaceae bacterium]